MNQPLIISIVSVGIGLATPILWAALGELIVEQSGVINVGVEGVMLISALVTAIAYSKTGNGVAGLAAGAGSGLVCGVVLAYWYVIRGMDQIVAGIIFNILALGLTTAVYSHLTYLAESLIKTFSAVRVPGVARIPYLGPMVFDQNPVIYAAFLTAPIVYVLMQKTWIGLYLRAAGERPRAVTSAGLDVVGLRFPAVVIGSGFAGVGGATIIVATSGGFITNITAGQGFIALALVVVARWNPFLVAAASVLFGTAQGLQYEAQGVAALQGVPQEVWLMGPYLLTVLAIVVVRGSRYPAACGIPYSGRRAGVIAPFLRGRGSGEEYEVVTSMGLE
jgi:ABC-type uncharacterized transport system permease subunit